MAVGVEPLVGEMHALGDAGDAIEVEGLVGAVHVGGVADERIGPGGGVEGTVGGLLDGIEWAFGEFSGWLGGILPASWWSDLLINGVVAGLSGIMVFVPQIMILFGLITILEDTGYMARISFLTDKLMRKVGLNGKSVMPMISGFACAVPAIMSARNIENRKERLLTIMITPLMSCSARLPVYTILIALVIPSKLYFGFLSLQGLVMMGLYLLGTVMALIVSWVMKWFIKSAERSFFILELPTYRAPRWKNALATMIEKAKIFVFDAGKVIMMISLLLWALSTYGPKQKMANVSAKYEQLIKENPQQVNELNNLTASNVVKGIDGEDWLILNRQKTKSRSTVPLLPIPKALINKYRDETRETLFPICSNQKFNCYLKEISLLLKINKRITTHWPPNH